MPDPRDREPGTPLSDLADVSDREPARGNSTSPVVTLVEGSSFCVSQVTGDIAPDGAQGLFFCDTRIVSDWRLQVGRRPFATLAVQPDEPFSATFLIHVANDSATQLLIERRRLVAAGMREDVTIRNLVDQPIRTTLTLNVSADFADLFAVKEGRPPHRTAATRTNDSDSVVFSSPEGERGVRVFAAGATLTADGLQFPVQLAPRAIWTTSIVVTPILAGAEVATSYPVGRPVGESVPARRMADWRRASPTITASNTALNDTLHRSLQDLGGLRISDPDHPGDVAVAAGAPWFMALFGRDSLLTSYMTIAVEPSLALGTLRTLARAQGTQINPATEEQPGRILHETRLGLSFPLIRGGGSTYYGTVDATPLFVVVLGELARWGVAAAEVNALIPAADRALHWCENYGDRDGDGFIEYQRLTPSGLLNQGWKDSADGITFAGGAIRTPPSRCARSRDTSTPPTSPAPHSPDYPRTPRPHGGAPTKPLVSSALSTTSSGCPTVATSPSASTATSNPSTLWPATWATAYGAASSTTTKPKQSPTHCSRRRCSPAGGSGR